MQRFFLALVAIIILCVVFGDSGPSTRVQTQSERVEQEYQRLKDKEEENYKKMELLLNNRNY